MILVDTSVIMYAAGAPHPHKAASVAFLTAVAKGDVDAAIDAEVLQEILHRYRAIGRWEDGRRAYDLARRVMPDVFDVSGETMDAAREWMDRYPGLSARDAVHVAVAVHLDAQAICTWDRDFDPVREVRVRRPGG